MEPMEAGVCIEFGALYDSISCAAAGSTHCDARWPDIATSIDPERA